MADDWGDNRRLKAIDRLVRRVTNAARLRVTYETGEMIWSRDTKDLYGGDGETPGGILIGGASVIYGAFMYTLDSSGFDGNTTVFAGLFPEVPHDDYAVIILRTGAPVLFDSGNDEPNPGQFSYSGMDVTFGVAPREGDQAVAIFVGS